MTDPVAWAARDSAVHARQYRPRKELGFTERKARTLADGLTCLLFWDESIDVVDRAAGVRSERPGIRSA